MQVFRGFRHPGVAPACALTIGNFDGVHRGHQAMLALLQTEARHRGLPSCVLTFEPHPRDYFAAVTKKPDLAPARIGTLRDKLTELAACGVAQTVVLPFDGRLASQSPEAFIQNVLIDGLGARYVLVGDDFRFGARRAGDYAMLDAAGDAHGFDVARMGHVVHGRKLGRALGASAPGKDDGFRTLNLRFKHWKPAASGIFAVLVHGLADQPLPGVANLGVRPSLDANDVNAGRVLLETHCLEWPSHLGAEGAYGKIVRVELLHKLHDELRYTSLEALTAGIAKDGRDARAFFASTHAETHRQTTRDRI
ncbi:MAG: bifunctional riboflavin kinase/FMN adenylyltransferase [Variovorax paradoxus]|nr:bifunctional riboflavin kinase/FMN adenylyltransferase [Variovorax paradoxus]MBW8718140.1 bifunctional riboflavin kinase/FMN adenylyltransferase [Variovorax paradoxus]